MNDFLLRRDNYNLVKFHQERKPLYSLREAFVKKFTPAYIKSMSIDDYIIGKGNKDSFCYWLEFKLPKLGRISSPAKKFGVYFHDGKLVAPKKYGQTWQDAFINIKKAILELIDSGEKGNLKTIRENIFGPLVKGKILATYYPDKYLNIFKKEHLIYFISAFGYQSKEKDEIALQLELINIKNKDRVMRSWTLDEFSNFLYFEFPGTPTDQDIKSAKMSATNKAVPIIEEVPELNADDRIREIDADTLTIEARHQKMQNGIMQCLFREGYTDIVAEDNHVDIKAKKNGVYHFFEVKTHDTAKECIREALGQILEYNHYPNNNRASEMCIIGPCKLTIEDQKYISFLRSTYRIKLFYRGYHEHANSLAPKQ